MSAHSDVLLPKLNADTQTVSMKGFAPRACSQERSTRSIQNQQGPISFNNQAAIGSIKSNKNHQLSISFNKRLHLVRD